MIVMKKIAVYLVMVFTVALLNEAKAQSTVYFASANGQYSLVEGNTFSFTVNLYSVSTTPITIDVVTTPGTADATDYTPLSTTVIIPAGQLSTTGMLSIPTTNDSAIETGEAFTINGTVISGVTTNTTLSRQIIIYDNDTIPTLSIPYTAANLSVNEFNSLTVNLRLSGYYNSDVVINMSTSDGTATTSDYTPVNSTITIPAGQLMGSQTISIINDAIAEPDEIFTLTATVTSGNTTNSGLSEIITIRDNDTTPTLSLTNYSVTEGEETSVYARLSHLFNTDVTFQFSTSDGTATSADYTPTIITKTITAGTYGTQITIPIIDDTVDEPMETFSFTANVTSGNTTNSSVTKNQTIVDNDGLPDLVVFSNSDGQNLTETVEEGQNVNYGIAVTHPSAVDTVVQITTSNGTAGNADYTSVTSTLTLPAGEVYISSPTLIPTILDQLEEGDETFTITGISTSNNTFNTTDTSIVTIKDNYNVNAQNDYFTSIAEVGGTFQVLANDTYHGLPLNASDVTITLSTNTIGATLDASGMLTVPASVPMGYYSMSYGICETLNPGNCDTGFIEIRVESPMVASYTASYSDFNGDGYTSAGDLINYQFSITNNGNAPISNVNLWYIQSSIIVNGGPIVQLNSGQTDSTTFTATHILTQNDINFGAFQNGGLGEIAFDGMYYGYQVYDFAEQQGVINLPNSDGIKLKAFVDSNSNGTQDPTEIDFPLGHFTYEVNNDGIIHNLYTNPFYLYESNPTTTYNLNYVVDSQYAVNNVCTVSYSNVTIVQSSGFTTYNFPISVTAYDDLSVSIHNYSQPPRPGFAYDNYVAYTNNSNHTIPSGTVTFTKDVALSISEVSNGATLTPTGFNYNFTNLLPYETQYIWIKMTVPTIPTVALGQLVTNSVSITTLPGDIAPFNNNSNLTQTIVGSYDPNDKQENHNGSIVLSDFTADDYLTYTIRFENTGTANAINIKVEDELDAQLDETTLKMIDASAEYTLERINRKLMWKFHGIDLPPSQTNSMIGHGYIIFKIKPKAGYTVGDIIPNTAEIYFDFNPAIITNTCTTEFVESLGNSTFVFNNLNCFPNPTQNSLTISNESLIDSVEITSVLGQKIFSQRVNSLQTEINLENVSKGIYFVKVLSEGQEKTVKIIKK